jgi:four helix bundle protein
MRTYKDLDVWQKSVSFVTKIYKVTASFPKSKQYGITNQIQRSSVSIPSNIAEGSKKSRKEFLYFIKIAQGSGAELETQLIISHNLNFLSKKEHDELTLELNAILKMLTKLHQSLGQATEIE